MLPKKDLYKNRIVIIASVSDINNKPLSQAEIYLGNNLIIGKTDINGNCRLVVDKKYIKWAFIIRKEGYKSMAFAFDNVEMDVHSMHYLLASK